jgi:hypothetical protein
LEQSSLLKGIHRDVKGILWLSDSPLHEFPEHYFELDYLFDGILSKFTMQFSKDQQQSLSFFKAEQFDNPIYLIHTSESEIGPQQINDFMQTIPSPAKTGQWIIIDKRGNFNVKALEQKSPGLKFTAISF